MDRRLAILIVVTAASLLGCAQNSTSFSENTQPDEDLGATEASYQAIAARPAAAGEAFSWREDDINDWVTNDEMVAVLADLSLEYGSVRLDGEIEFDPVATSAVGADVRWTVGQADGENHWQVWVDGGDHLRDDVWSHETELTLPQGEITYAVGWGILTARGPNSDESFCIGLEAPTEVFGRYVEEHIYVEMVSVLASMMLEELGWVD